MIFFKFLCNDKRQLSTLIFVRFCPQGVPSGRSREDMFSEVRKEAYNTRYLKSDKSNSSSNVPDDDEEDAEEPSSITSGISSDAWSIWYLS